jgi:two-component system cell cycle response regulator
MDERYPERSPKRRILVVEDDPATLTLLQRQLERAGYAVIACADGREALTAVTASGTDIVVADWLMPVMTGIELCRALRELRTTGALPALYFILLTAHAERDTVVEGLEAGADDFLRKPYDFQELLARIRAGERILRLQEDLIERQLELAKSNAQLAVLNQRLTRLASFDPLTELPNRRCILERLHEAWSMAQRHDHRLSCIMADIDDFKKVNDRNGHRAGDVVLRAIAHSIQQSTRDYERCGRFGGEEFLVVCPLETVEAAATLAERLRLIVEQCEFKVGDASVRVTISLGVAAARAEHPSPDALIAEADSMLYAAKQNGRNCVWYADRDGVGHHLDPAPAQPVADALNAGPFTLWPPCVSGGRRPP